MKNKNSNNISKLSKQTIKRPSKKKGEMSISSRTLVDRETGEIIETTEVTTKATDINFDKIFLGHIIQAMEIIGNKKIQLLMFLFAIKNSDNQIIMTQREMAKKSGISLKTVSDTLKALQQRDFIVKKSSSVYVINPNMIFKGSSQKRMNILLSYEQIQLEKISNETKIGDNPETYLLEDSEPKDISEYTTTPQPPEGEK